MFINILKFLKNKIEKMILKKYKNNFQKKYRHGLLQSDKNLMIDLNN